MAALPVRQKRRSSAEIRSLILEAARVLFTERGFDATTTRQIAERANVHEHLIFSNFGSKADLFDAAVTTPLSEIVTSYVDSWAQDSASSSPAERISTFIDALYQLGKANRSLLQWALTNGGHAGAGRRVLEHVANTLHDVVQIDTRDYPDMDKEALLPAIGAMALGAALLDDMLFPPSARRPSKARLTAEMKKMVIARAERAFQPAEPRERRVHRPC